ncbi:MAG: NAD(P)/FAD-dependent oxidoreductase [Bosea sp. (in: a-proteobacteria)]
MSRRAIVLGAGMVGVSCALSLQKRGLQVTLIDRKPPGRETSYGNAGVISRASIVPINGPSLWKNLPRYIGNRHPALRWRLRDMLLSPRWILRFLAQTRPSQMAHRVDALDALLKPAVGLHKAWMAEAGISHRLRETGWLKLWRSEDGLAAAQAEQAMLAKRGIVAHVLDRQAISGLEPHLRPIFPVGLLHADTASVDEPGAVTEAYAELFVARGGTILQSDILSLKRQASGWQVNTGAGEQNCDLVVVALGPWSADLLRPLGLSVPLGVERGYHRHYLPAQGARLSRPIYDVDAAYVLAPMSQGYRITSGVELAARDAAPDHAQIEAALPRAREAFDLGDSTDPAPWRGARPTLPDSLPMIGEVARQPGLFLAFGHQHIGFSTGPVTGEMIAALASGEVPIVDPAPFAPARYL